MGQRKAYAFIQSNHVHSIQTQPKRQNPNFRSIQYLCRNQLTAKATEDFHFPWWVSKEDPDTIQEPISLKSQIGRFKETNAMMFFGVREREEDLKRSMKSNWNGKWKSNWRKRTRLKRAPTVAMRKRSCWDYTIENRKSSCRGRERFESGTEERAFWRGKERWRCRWWCRRTYEGKRKNFEKGQKLLVRF